MRRFAAIIAALSFFAMITLDSSACYLMMLTCEPVANCFVRAETAPPDCRTSCGLPDRQQRVSCEPDDPQVRVVCMIGLSSDASLRQFCECSPAPPLTSILAERRTLDVKSPADLPVTYRTKSSQSDQDSVIRDSRPQGVHLTIPTTVLRC